MTFELDTHTHTLASGHAYSTIKEMAEAASDKGLKLLAITEHGIKMPGTCHPFYFHNIMFMNHNMCGVELLFGVEANIMNEHGELDMDEFSLDRLDIVIASLHLPCFTPGTMEQNTNALIGAMKNPYVNIIGHPDDSRYPLDYEKIVRAAKEYDVLLELNNRSLFPGGFRTDAKANDIRMLELCKQYDVSISLGSDAHFADDIANYEYCLKVVEETNFPHDKIVNYNADAFKAWLANKRSKIQK